MVPVSTVPRHRRLSTVVVSLCGDVDVEVWVLVSSVLVPRRIVGLPDFSDLSDGSRRGLVVVVNLEGLGWGVGIGAGANAGFLSVLVFVRGHGDLVDGGRVDLLVASLLGLVLLLFSGR